jgi:hypothetical protein
MGYRWHRILIRRGRFGFVWWRRAHARAGFVEPFGHLPRRSVEKAFRVAGERVGPVDNISLRPETFHDQTLVYTLHRDSE